MTLRASHAPHTRVHVQRLNPQPDDHYATFHAIPTILAAPSLAARLFGVVGGASASSCLPRLGARPGSGGGGAWRFWEGKAGAAALADPATAKALAIAVATDAYAAVKDSLKGRAVLCPPPPALLEAAPGVFEGAALWSGALVAGEEAVAGQDAVTAAVTYQAAIAAMTSTPRSPRPAGRGGRVVAASSPPPPPPTAHPLPGVDLPPAAVAVIAGVVPHSSLATDQAEALAELDAVLAVCGFVAHWAGKGWGLGVQRPAVESV